MTAAVLNRVEATVPASDDPVGTVPLAGASAGMPVPAEAISPNDVVSVAVERREDVQLVSPGESATTGSPAADTTLPRDYFGSGHVADLPRFESLVGPLSPTPNLTLADAISRAVAADERWYALNNGWVA